MPLGTCFISGTELSPKRNGSHRDGDITEMKFLFTDCRVGT